MLIFFHPNIYSKKVSNKMLVKITLVDSSPIKSLYLNSDKILCITGMEDGTSMVEVENHICLKASESADYLVNLCNNGNTKKTLNE